MIGVEQLFVFTTNQLRVYLRPMPGWVRTKAFHFPAPRLIAVVKIKHMPRPETTKQRKHVILEWRQTAAPRAAEWIRRTADWAGVSPNPSGCFHASAWGVLAPRDRDHPRHAADIQLDHPWFSSEGIQQHKAFKQKNKHFVLVGFKVNSSRSFPYARIKLSSSRRM